MSYIRMGEEGSDVYVFPHIDEGIECCGCSISPSRIFRAYSAKEIISHLEKHLSKGDYVPQHVFYEIKRDYEE